MSFDDNRNLIEEKNINPKNKVSLVIRNTYTPNNELVQTEYYNAEEKLVRIEKKKYNESGKLVFYTVIDENGYQTTTETSYNDYEKISGFIQTEGEAITESVSYNYDNNQNIVEVIDNLDRNSSYNIQYQYTYDEKSNWIKKIISTKNYPSQIVKRAITYF
jgi:hypothetical protein